MTAGARRHVAVHLDGEAARAVDELRAVRDPVMRADVPFTAGAALWTETDDAGRRVLRTFPLAGQPVRRRETVVAAALDEHERLAWFTAAELGSLDLALPDYLRLLGETLAR